MAKKIKPIYFKHPNFTGTIESPATYKEAVEAFLENGFNYKTFLNSMRMVESKEGKPPVFAISDEGEVTLGAWLKQEQHPFYAAQVIQSVVFV